METLRRIEVESMKTVTSLLGGTATLTGHQMVDDQLVYGAENFYRMWQKDETQKARVP